MRTILLIVPVLLIGLIKWPVPMLAAFYLAGVAWLAYEYWRAPMVNEQGAIVTTPSEKTNRGAGPNPEPEDVKRA